MGQESRLMPAVTIKAGNSVSETVSLYSTSLVGFVAPLAWTVAPLSIEVSLDQNLWLSTLYDSQQSQVGVFANIVVGAGYAVDPLAFMPYRFARFRSGTQAAPVAQAADAVITAITRPLA